MESSAKKTLTQTPSKAEWLTNVLFFLLGLVSLPFFLLKKGSLLLFVLPKERSVITGLLRMSFALLMCYIWDDGTSPLSYGSEIENWLVSTLGKSLGVFCYVLTGTLWAVGFLISFLVFIGVHSGEYCKAECSSEQGNTELPNINRALRNLDQGLLNGGSRSSELFKHIGELLNKK